RRTPRSNAVLAMARAAHIQTWPTRSSDRRLDEPSTPSCGHPSGSCVRDKGCRAGYWRDPGARGGCGSRLLCFLAMAVLLNGATPPAAAVDLESGMADFVAGLA